MFSTALKLIAPAPAATQVAPIRPPKSACDELDGSPRNQVTRFHRMAPTSPAKITTGLMSFSSTSPPEIVFATWTDRKAPTRFRHRGQATAVLGRNAPVAIDVAMALAVSWKPFVKSKASAVSTTRRRSVMRPWTAPFADRPEPCRSNVGFAGDGPRDRSGQDAGDQERHRVLLPDGPPTSAPSPEGPQQRCGVRVPTIGVAAASPTEDEPN